MILISLRLCVCLLSLQNIPISFLSTPILPTQLSGQHLSMRTLCPNFDREDCLDTVLEVPIPEEMFASSNKSNNSISWHNMKAWMRPSDKSNAAGFLGGRNTEVQLLLGVVGAPLFPLPVSPDHQLIGRNIKDQPIESSMAKYILKQYTAAVGGEKALAAIESMYAMGKVKMAASEFSSGDKILSNNKAVKVKKAPGEMGGFVLWQKGPELWCLELVVSGCKISAGSDGKVAWRQTPWHHSHASRGPPRPLRRFLQGLDPKSTENLFSNSVCVGEKAINDDDCFILKLEADSPALRARSSNNVEILRHTVWGYFSQRTGLLVQLEDSHLLRIKAPGQNDCVFWETTMVSLISDYRTIEGVCIAHGGRTTVSLFRFGENSQSHSKTRMEEVWAIEEVDFNIKGLSMDCFLPPADLKKDQDQEAGLINTASHARSLPYKIRSASFRINASKVATIDVDDHENITNSTDDDEDEDEEFHL